MPRALIKSTFFPGGNQWSIDADNCMGMQNYIHLCFLDEHPMEWLAKEKGRIDPVWLEISTEVLDFSGVKYCAGVANQAGAVYLTSSQAIKNMDFDYLFNWHDFNVIENRDRHNEAKKYEILVPGSIPINYIVGGL